VERIPQAAFRASIATLVGAALMLVPPIGVPVFLLVFMLPLWAVDAIGIVDVGSEVHGFFVPNAAGRVLAVVVVWSMFFLLFRAIAARKTAAGARADGPGTRQ